MKVVNAEWAKAKLDGKEAEWKEKARRKNEETSQDDTEKYEDIEVISEQTLRTEMKIQKCDICGIMCTDMKAHMKRRHVTCKCEGACNCADKSELDSNKPSDQPVLQELRELDCNEDDKQPVLTDKFENISQLSEYFNDDMINLSDETLPENEGEKEVFRLEGNKETLEKDLEKEMEYVKIGNEKESDYEKNVMVKFFGPAQVISETEAEYKMEVLNTNSTVKTVKKNDTKLFIINDKQSSEDTGCGSLNIYHKYYLCLIKYGLINNTSLLTALSLSLSSLASTATYILSSVCSFPTVSVSYTPYVYNVIFLYFSKN